MQVTAKSSSSRDTSPFRFHRRERPFSGLHFLPARWTIHKKRPPPHKTEPAPALHPVSQTRAQQVLAAAPPTSFAIRANELRVAFESEEKARPAYEKALRRFHRLRAFAELESPDNLDILF